MSRKPRLTPSSIFARIRPYAIDDSGHKQGEAAFSPGLCKVIHSWDDTSVTIHDADRRQLCRYRLTGCVGPQVSNIATYNTLLVESGLLQAFHSDQHVLFFAYGQTGTGKTHTMLGPSHAIQTKPSPDWGIFPRLVYDTLQTCERWKADGIHATLFASAVEFYCGKGYDLLSTPKNEVQVDKNANLFGQESIHIRTVAELGHFISQAYANRVTNKTLMNDSSSRGHTALVITLHKIDGDQYTRNTFSLIDMAGSERSDKTGFERITKIEAAKEMKAMLEAGTPELLSVGTQGFMINTEHSHIMTEVQRASEAHRSRRPFRPGHSPSEANKYFQGCCDGSARLGAVITLSLSDQHGFETWFGLQYSKALMQLHAPVKHNKATVVSKALQMVRLDLDRAHAGLEKNAADLAAMPQYRELWEQMRVLFELQVKSGSHLLEVLEEMGGAGKSGVVKMKGEGGDC